MNNTLRKIGIILIAVIVVPALLFITFELSSLNSNERVIEKIYESQLDAVLFSVNQYSQDIVESWAGKIEATLITDEKPVDFQVFLKENSSIKGIVFGDLDKLTVQDSFGDITDKTGQLNLYNKLLSAKSELIMRLINYRKSGYRKIESLTTDSSTTSLIFTFTSQVLQNKFCILIINSDSFIQKVLSPRIESISQDEFAIYIQSDLEDYNTGNKSISTYNGGKIQKAMWLLPGYQLGISLKGETIESLVQQRATTNLLLIVLLIIVLFLGVYIVFRNVKKEIEIAQMKSDFISNVSHELRTPLSMISMFSETLEMGRVASEEKRQEYYKIISQETSRLSRIVNSILSFSKIEAGKRKYNFVDSFLNDIVDTVYSSYETHLRQNGFKTEFIRDENIPVQQLDEEAVSEAVMNLLDNAIKYSKDKKSIIIKTGLKKHYSFVEVKDLGIGISKENEEKIFEKFYRVSTGSVHNVKGTGLGLSIVKHIVESHGGTIELESSSGNGSTFRLKFPLKKLKDDHE